MQIDSSRMLLLTPEQAAWSISVSRSTMYELLREGVVSSVKIGGLRRVPAEALEEFVKSLTRREGQDKEGAM